jgi:hypothetical protein
MIPTHAQNEEGDSSTESVANFKVNPNVVAQRVDDQVVLVNLETNRIFALNPTGARLWELLSAGHSEAEIRAKLIEEYGIAQAELEAEVDRLMHELNGQSLVKAHDDE